MSQISSKITNSLFSANFGGHFCYHSNGKSQINTRCLHLGYCPNKVMRRKWRKAFFLYFSLSGGQHSLLTHAQTLWVSRERQGPPIIVGKNIFFKCFPYVIGHFPNTFITSSTKYHILNEKNERIQKFRGDEVGWGSLFFLY